MRDTYFVAAVKQQIFGYMADLDYCQMSILHGCQSNKYIHRYVLKLWEPTCT